MATKPKYIFKPEMCDKLVELGKTGASQKIMFSELGISTGAANTFKKNHPEFSDALDLAITHSQAYWERQMLENIDNKAFNSRIVEIALRGQFPNDYREEKANKVDLKVDATIDFGSAVNDLITSLKKAV